MKQGYGVFSKEYEIMLRNDVHDPDSIDGKLLERMILLDEESFAYLYSDINHYDLSSHELYDYAKQFKGNTDKETVNNVLVFTSDIAKDYDVDFKDMLFGGSEKQIIERKTDWCADMVRVAAVLLMCNDIPSRIIQLANLDKAYNGHVAVEAYYEDHYGFIDPLYGYQFYDNEPVSVYEIQNNHDYLKDYDEYYSGLFSAVAISDYNPMDLDNKYIITKPNEYTTRIIYEDHDGKWFMNEDKV